MRAAKETLLLVGRALLLVFRHWPTLLALIFAGLLARQATIKLAVLASDVHRALGLLAFALVPLGMLVAMVLMLRTLRPSLPTVAAVFSGGAGERLGARGVLSHLASVLVPFIFVYGSFDYFADDKDSYIYQIWEDETLANPDIFNGPGSTDIMARLPGELDMFTISVVVAAALGRWLIGLWRAGQTKTFVGLSNAYLEVVWMTTAVAAFNGAQEQIGSRRVAVWAQETWHDLLDKLGSLSGVAEFFGGVLLAADVVIVVPLAWLAVSAIVYGRKLSEGSDLLTQQGRKRWLRMPAALRSDVSSSFGPLAKGLRQLRHFGLGPMVLFCLVFIVVQTTPNWLFQLERLIIGPQDLETIWWPLSGVLAVFNDAVGAMLLICLVAATVDRVLSLQPEADATTAGIGGGPGSSSSGGGSADVPGGAGGPEQAAWADQPTQASPIYAGSGSAG